MRYEEYCEQIHVALSRRPAGFTWAELKSRLALPYARPCPNWTTRLELDIGLIRVSGIGRAKIWRLAPPASTHRPGKVNPDGETPALSASRVAMPVKTR
jgi:hypothetical protein